LTLSSSSDEEACSMRASRSGALAPVVLSLPHAASRLQLARAWINAGANESKAASELSSEASTALHQLLQKHSKKDKRDLAFAKPAPR